MAPDKIYIFQDGDMEWYKPEDWETPPPDRVAYIRKDALLEWAKEKEDYALTRIVKFTYRTIIEKIESL